MIGVWQTAPRLNIKDLDASPSDYFTFREENRTFQQFGVWNGGSVAVTGRAAPEQVRCLFVTEGTLNALGVAPALGRWFTPADDKPDAPETAILTYGYWQRKFGGDPAAVGSQLIVDGKLTAIAGVMPQSFRFLDEKPELILPMRFDRAKLHLGNFSYPRHCQAQAGSHAGTGERRCGAHDSDGQPEIHAASRLQRQAVRRGRHHRPTCGR